MKQRKLSGTNSTSCSDECNGHVNNFKRANIDECRSTNGNHIRHKIQIKSDKPKKFDACAYEPQMNKLNRSQQQWWQQQQQQMWCRQFYDSKLVQYCSFRIRPNYAKFAFHETIRAIVVIALVLFSVHCVSANGQQIDSQWNAKNTGE